MANELVHSSAGTTLTQAEFEAVGLHVFNSQAQGDILYASSATQLTRLGAGTAGNALVTGGAAANPSWFTGLTFANDGTKTTILGLSGDYTRFGDASTTSRSLNSEDDVLFTGKCEYDSWVYYDGNPVLGANMYVDDGVYILMGSSPGTDGLRYNTADANANLTAYTFRAGGAVDVPVFAFMPDTATGTNLGFFDGIVEPTVAILNAAGDAYVTLNAGDINGSPVGSGLYFKPAADEDVNILLVGVTENASLIWDDSETEYYFSQRVNALAYAAAGTDGIDFNGAVTNITVVKGIVTAAS